MTDDIAERKAILEYVVNQPEVLKGTAPGYEHISLDAFLDKPVNLMVGDRKGVILFAYHSRGIYEMHYLLTNQLRGPEVLARIKEAIRQLFTYRDCYAITGATPRDNRAARAINRALGGRPIGACIDTQGRDCITYVLERDTWVHLSGA